MVHPLPQEGVDFEMFLFKNGFADEYISILEGKARSSNEFATEWIIATETREQEETQEKEKETRHIILKKDGHYEVKIVKKAQPDHFVAQTDSIFQSLFAEIIIAQLQKDKVRHAEALIRKLRTSSVNAERVPPFFAKIITDIVTRAAL